MHVYVNNQESYAHATPRTSRGRSRGLPRPVLATCGTVSDVCPTVCTHTCLYWHTCHACVREQDTRVCLRGQTCTCAYVRARPNARVCKWADTHLHITHAYDCAHAQTRTSRPKRVHANTEVCQQVRDRRSSHHARQVQPLDITCVNKALCHAVPGHVPSIAVQKCVCAHSCACVHTYILVRAHMTCICMRSK